MNAKRLLASLFLGAVITELFLGEFCGALPQVPPFHLIDQNNQPFTKTNLLGKTTVLSFFFASCPSICPLQHRRLLIVKKSININTDLIQFVSITVDPERDSPSELWKYAEKNGVGANWFFLTGDKNTITALSEYVFKLGSIKEPAAHSTRAVIIDRAGEIEDFFQIMSDDDLKRLEKRLISEVINKNQIASQK
ncbi:MAG TPA: SCO family protein [Oligoflexia bacterium]|nr:SCO family protein [Oligoflexia bacterium]HMP26778.1 SCO family protein [Oligoflexia bacterium]